MAPRAEVPPKSRFKHLERQPTLSASNDTKGVSGPLANRPLDPAEPTPGQPKSLPERAREEMDLWFRTLTPRDRGRLKIERSSWGRNGGSTIVLGPRHGKTARRQAKLKREREARLKAEQAAYVARAATFRLRFWDRADQLDCPSDIASPPTGPHLGCGGIARVAASGT